MAEEKTIELEFKGEDKTASTAQTFESYLPFIENLRRNPAVSSVPQVFVGSSSRGTTGTQIITGVGFLPKLIKVTAFYTGNNNPWCMISATSASNTSGFTFYYTGAAWNTASQSAGTIVNLLNTGGGSTSYATLTSLDADGFTIEWASVAATVYFTFECYA